MSTNATNPTYNRRRAKRAALAKLGLSDDRRPKSGNNVSHAHNKTKRLFRANVQRAKILVDGKLVSVRVPASELRSLTKRQKELERKTPKRKAATATTKKTAAAKKPSVKKAAPKAAAKK